MEDYLLLTVMMDDVGTWSLEIDRKWDCSQALIWHQKFGALEFLILAIDPTSAPRVHETGTSHDSTGLDYAVVLKRL
jgi:hypothetical protein